MEKKKINTLLWLDDIRNPHEGDWLVFSPIENPNVTWVKSYKEFVTWIELYGLPDGICFDHDLGDNFEIRTNTDVDDWFDIEENREYTGYDCAKWLVNYCLDNGLDLPLYNIQSANPVGKENIDRLLKQFKNYK
jgi:hypothetical protein